MANPQTMTSYSGLSRGCSTSSYVHLDNMAWHDITDLDLIATLFSLTLEQETALRLAKEALQTAGSLSQLIQMPANELHDLISESQHAVALINLLRLGMYRTVNERTSDQVSICSPEAMIEYVATHRNTATGGNRRIVLLDRDSRVIRDLSMSVAGTNIAVCRNIAQEALKTDAFGLIIIDYLYKDDLQISQKSSSLVDMIEVSMMNINVQLYDYLIVGINRFYSKKGNKIIDLYK